MLMTEDTKRDLMRVLSAADQFHEDAYEELDEDETTYPEDLIGLIDLALAIRRVRQFLT